MVSHTLHNILSARGAFFNNMYLLTSATSSSATALDEEFVPQFREFGLESTKVIIRGLVLLSWYDIMLLSLIIYHFKCNGR